MVSIPAIYGRPGTYGTLGKPGAANIPGGRSPAATWIDQAGHLWLFGGYGLDANEALGALNDLWELNPSTNEWTWRGGSNTLVCGPYACGVSGTYGTIGSPASANIPGGRYIPATWIDNSGNFWLFGGEGLDANGDFGYSVLPPTNGPGSVEAANRPSVVPGPESTGL